MKIYHLFLCLAFVACGSSGAQTTTESEPIGDTPVVAKGPIDIEVKLDGNTAKVQLIFAEHGTAVSVSALGGRELVVKQEVVAVELTVEAGRLIAFDVPFEPAVAPSTLTIEVKGNFGGTSRVKAVTVEVSGTTPAPPIEH